jgi:hypothetical protein
MEGEEVGGGGWNGVGGGRGALVWEAAHLQMHGPRVDWAVAGEREVELHHVRGHCVKFAKSAMCSKQIGIESRCEPEVRQTQTPNPKPQTPNSKPQTPTTTPAQTNAAITHARSRREILNYTETAAPSNLAAAGMFLQSTVAAHAGPRARIYIRRVKRTKEVHFVNVGSIVLST